MTRKKLDFLKFANKAIRSGSATTAVALTVLLTTASAWAQPATPSMENMPAKSTAKSAPSADLMIAFANADANKDGKLSKEEAAGISGLTARFEAFDTDGDKFVSKEEFEKGVQ